MPKGRPVPPHGSGPKEMPDRIALFVIEQKALVHRDYPGMPECQIKDEAMMRMARELLRLKSSTALRRTP